MVKVYDKGGFRVYVYAPPREHGPPHVHVEAGRGGEVLVRLGNELTGPTLWQNHHMSAVDARRALRIVAERRQYFLETWRRLHG